MELPEWCGGDPNSVANTDAFLVKHIELDWTVDFAQQQIDGHVILHIQSLTHSDELVLDASALDITRVTDNDNGTALVFTRSAGKFGGKLTIRVRPSDSHRVKIEYCTTEAGQALQWLRPEYQELSYPYITLPYLLGRLVVGCIRTCLASARPFWPGPFCPAKTLPRSRPLTRPQSVSRTLLPWS